MTWCWNPAIVMLLTSCFVDCVDVWWWETEKPDNFFSFLLFFPLYVCTCAPRHRRFFVLHVTCLLPTNGRRCLLAAFRRSLIWLVPGQNTGGPSSPNEVEGKHNSSYKLVVSTQSSSHFLKFSPFKSRFSVLFLLSFNLLFNYFHSHGKMELQLFKLYLCKFPSNKNFSALII